MRDTDPDREYNLYVKRWIEQEKNAIRKRYPLPLDDDAIARSQADVERLRSRYAAMQAEREDLIARAQQAIEETVDLARKDALTELLDLYRRCPTAGEDQHITADNVLLTLIDDEMIAELFEALPKWYA